MRVMHLIVGLNRGGAEMMLCRLVQEPSTRTIIEHRVISLTDAGAYGSNLRNAGFDVIELGLKKRPMSVLSTFMNLVRHIKYYKPDVLQTWMVHSDLIGGLAGWVAKVPRIVWGVRTTNFSVESRMTRIVRWFCARLSTLIPDRIICAAQASLDSSVRAGYDPKKMMVIANGFDLDALNGCLGMGVNVRENIGLSGAEVVVGSVGRYNPAKDHANFVSAAGLVAAENPNVRFLMVGRDVDCSNFELKKLIDATGFSDRFVLLGESDEPASCIDAMDVFVLSSCTEGFPNVLGEAMAMGVPCVTTNVGDAALLVGETAEVVTPKDPRALAMAINRLLALASSERQKIGSRSRERLIENFSITATAKLFAQVYTELVMNTELKTS